MVCAWPATGDAKRTASRNAPAFSFHAALTYDFTSPLPQRPSTGPIKHRVDSNQTNENRCLRFYGKLARSQMSSLQRKAEKPFLVLFGHSHSQSQSHNARRLPHRGTRHTRSSGRLECLAGRLELLLHRPTGAGATCRASSRRASSRRASSRAGPQLQPFRRLADAVFRLVTLGQGAKKGLHVKFSVSS